MRVSVASESGRADGRNEDWAGVTPYLSVVLDGLSELAGTGCVHGTPWYVDQLGSQLLCLAAEPGRPLAEALATAIERVADRHRDSCDLAHPGTPGCTVAMVRMAGTAAEYLVLSDSVVVFDRPGEPLVVTDRRVTGAVADKVAAVPGAAGGSDRAAWTELIRSQQLVRNQPGGYWVAQVDPAAAGHARTGTVPAVGDVALLSDGAALLVTDFHQASWAGLLEILRSSGPAGLIAATRELEDRDPDRVTWPRYKHRDDATAVFRTATAALD